MGGTARSVDARGNGEWRGATPCQRIGETGLFELLAFGEEGRRSRVPVVVCYSNVNRAYILDFVPQLSVIRQFIRNGLAVYLIHWKAPQSGDLGLKEYATEAIDEAVGLVHRRAQCDAVHLFGYCWGGVFAAIYAALCPESLASLTLLATPIDCAGPSPSTIELWARMSQFDPDSLADGDGFIPGQVFKRIVLCSSPVQSGLGKLYELLDCRNDPNLLRAYFEGQRWLHDTPRIARAVFSEMIRKVYQRNELSLGILSVGGKNVHLSAIRCPVISIVGENDHLVSPGGSLKINELVSSPRPAVQSFRVPTGHVGLTCSVKTHTQVWPNVTRALASL